MSYRNLFIYPFFNHSAKGSSWEKHKYIKKMDNKYYYPDSYEGGRHLPSSSKPSENRPSGAALDDNAELTKDDIERLAREVIRGDYGNGQIRKDLLGYNYQVIQDRVNEILKNSSSGSTKISDVSSESLSEVKEEIEKVVSSPSGGIDLDLVYSVYNKRK